MKKILLRTILLFPALLCIAVSFQEDILAADRYLVGRTVYIPIRHLRFKPEYRYDGGTGVLSETRYNFSGFGLRAEYNQRYGRISVSTGMEWNMLMGMDDIRGVTMHYIIPDGIVKLFPFKKLDLYLGAGLVGLIPVNTIRLDEVRYDWRPDLWGKFLLGYCHDVSEDLIVDMELAYNTVITFNQWSTGRRVSDGLKVRVIPDYTYDIKVSLGVGRKI